MRHAYARIKNENPEPARQWNEAIREPAKETMICRCSGKGSPSERPPYDLLKLLGAGLLLCVFGVLFFIAADVISNRYGIHWKPGPGTHTAMTARL